MTALTTEAFLQRVQQQTPGSAAEAIVRLRQQSVRVEAVQADPLTRPGGMVGESAWRDQQHAVRRPIKILLAGNKLHVGLVTAALRRTALDGAAEAPDSPTNGGMASDGVTD
ncbi:MAG: hypothetical protein JNN26_27250, partial [Candidatus Obscuribacter sp.]|nr:hypothetical protein [Candidatus Obscuribacter sp.]